MKVRKMSNKRRRSIPETFDKYFEDLEESFERFREAIIQKPSWNLRECTIEPLREIIVTPLEVMVTVDLPYAEESAVRVKAVDDVSIEVSAAMKQKVQLEDLGIFHCKGEIQKLHSLMRIPVPVNMDKMDVHLKKGILEIHLPRKR